MLIGFCLLCAQGGLWAQAMPYSQIVRHNNIAGTEIITRVSPSGAVMTCSKSVDGNRRHTFMYTLPSTGYTKYFTCNLGTLFSNGLDDYSIKDMYIFEDKCYFCGSCWIKEYEPLYDPSGNIIASGYVPYGFVGYFDLFSMPVITVGSFTPTPPDPPVPPLSNPFLDSIYLMIIPETDSIMHLVAHHDYPSSYDVFLMAVGYTSRYSHPTCVVELTKPVGTSDTYWMLNIVQPTCAETDEYMTDIVLTESHVVVASKLPYADGDEDGDTDPTHYQFRLHEAKRDGFYNTTVPPPSSASVYQYDVSSYGIGIGCHHNGDPIRLCPMDGNRFCVYYHGWRRYTYPYDGLAGPVLFWMDGAGIMEDAASLYPQLIYGHTKEAAWVGDSYKTIAILVSDNPSYPEGVVIFPTLQPTQPPHDICHAQRIQGVSLHSIECNPTTQYLYIGGTYPDNKLCHGIEGEANYCDHAPTCLYYSLNNFVLKDPQETTEEYCEWSVITGYSSIMIAKKAIVDLSAYNAEIMCTQEINE